MMCSRYFQRYLRASKRHIPLSQCKYMQTIYDVKYPHGVWTACELKDTGVGATEVSDKLFFVQHEGYCWVHAEIIRSEELFVTLILFSTGTTASCDKRGKSVISDNHLHLFMNVVCVWVPLVSFPLCCFLSLAPLVMLLNFLLQDISQTRDHTVGKVSAVQCPPHAHYWNKDTTFRYH